MNPRKPLLLAASVASFLACGSRTGIPIPILVDAGPDATMDAAADVVEEPDVREAGIDATEEPEADAGEEDALPPIDVVELDAPNPCPDAGSTFIYVITQSTDLYSFYPPTGTFSLIGAINCPTVDPLATPFSMAVDRKGIAYVVYADLMNPSESGQLFRVSTADASCEATPFVRGQNGFPLTFGMGYAANVGVDGGVGIEAGGPDGSDIGETLYVAGDTGSSGNPGNAILGSIDTTTFRLTTIGAFNPLLLQPELTGTGAGQLFGFASTDDTATSSEIAQIETANARVTGVSDLPGLAMGSGWAFAFWGGDFYTFTAPQDMTVVTRFSPSTGSMMPVASTSQLVVGAGVSTCAPQQ